MNKSLAIVLAATTVTMCLVVVVKRPKLKQYSEIVGNTQPRGASMIDKYKNFVADSDKKWGQDVISLSDVGWQLSLMQSVGFIYKQNDGMFGTNPLDRVTKDMRDSLTNNVISFFTAYVDGSFDAYTNFHARANYSLNFASFTDDDGFLEWLRKHDRDFQTDEQKLKAIWDYTSYDNARGIWIKDQLLDLKKSNKGSVNLIDATRSLEGEFEKNVAASKLSEFQDYRISAVSRNDFYVYIFSSASAGLSSEALGVFQNAMFRGTQAEGHRIYHYENGPNEMVKLQGSCDYAIMTAAVRVNSCECYVPIAVAFYWSSRDSDWLPITMGRYSFGNYYALF